MNNNASTSANTDCDVVFAHDESAQTKPNEFWKILLVDDEAEMHNVTKLALRNFTFENKFLEFIHAYSADEAKELIAENPDIAVILLDVVMETDDAGLQVAKWIRETLGNQLVRIILRTGQPGAAPEKDVILNYEINEYKTKTELTAQKLFTTFVASLRNYRDLRMIESNRKGLEKIIDASGSLFEIQSMEQFISGVLTQLTALLHLDNDALYCRTTCFATAEPRGELMVLAGTGSYAECQNKRACDALPGSVFHDLQEASRQKKTLYFDDRCVIYFFNKNEKSNMVYLEGIDNLKQVDRHLLEVFCSNISIAIDNISLIQEIQGTQQAVLDRIGGIAESRSEDGKNHVKRVAEYSKLLALKCGMSLQEAELLKQASPLHDIGKAGISDAILRKPGKLSQEEWEVMKTHARLGADMLGGSKRPVLQAAAIVARSHHEKWDGSGYPGGLGGVDIPVYGRIAALADVFDTLGHERCYQDAWPLDAILDMLKRESGKHFDPTLVDLLLLHLPEFLAVQNMLRDD